MEYILRILPFIGVKDIADIVLVSVLVYQFLLVGQGTRAVQIIFSVLGFGVLYWIGQIYQLYLLNWILGHFFDSFFIIAAILFQDQIRQVLSSFSFQKKFFGGISRQEVEVEIDEVSEAVGAMAKEKIGALIVIERSHGLLNYINTGSLVEAHVNSDLLYSIFDSKSSLHDGAVIIAHGKIVAAGCFLPLSKNVEIDKNMGTRHRAGLGLSETSDAVVVIVSEETGKITICFEGEFYPCRDEMVLRKKLREVLSNLRPELKVKKNRPKELVIEDDQESGP